MTVRRGLHGPDATFLRAQVVSPAVTGAPPEFAAFAAACHGRLGRAAFLLTGDRAAAEDLVQETLVRALVEWRKVERADDPFAYTRRIMTNHYLTSRRRRWHRGEAPTASLPDAGHDGGLARADDRDALRRALAALPPRQRAAVVLRRYEDLSETATAQVMGTSVGNVKSLTSRGLAALRLALGEQEPARGRAAEEVGAWAQET